VGVVRNSPQLQRWEVSPRAGRANVRGADRIPGVADHVEGEDTAAAAVRSLAEEDIQGSHRALAAVRMPVAAGMVPAGRTVDHTELGWKLDIGVGHTVQVGRTVQEVGYPGADTEAGHTVPGIVLPGVGTAVDRHAHWDEEVLGELCWPSRPFCHNSCRYFRGEAWCTRAPWLIPWSGSFA
jgi:hypothetical protein